MLTTFSVQARAALRSSILYRNAFRSVSPLATSSRLFTSFHALRDDDDAQKQPFYTQKSEATRTLFVGNIPWGTNPDELWKVFSPFGEVDDVRIGKNWDGRPAGYAHVKFVDAQNALSALEADQQEPLSLQDRDLHVTIANIRNRERPVSSPSPTLYVGNIPYEAEVGEISRLFAPFGEITDIRMGFAHSGQRLGFAHVDFSSKEEAEKAFQAHQETPLCVWTRTLVLDFALGAPLRQINKSRLYVKGFRGTSAELRQVFADFLNNIVRIKTLTDPVSGGTSGVAFIHFINEQSAKEALDTLSGKEIQNGEKLTIAYAHEQEQDNNTRGERSRLSRLNRSRRQMPQNDPFDLRST